MEIRARSSLRLKNSFVRDDGPMYQGLGEIQTERLLRPRELLFYLSYQEVSRLAA